MFCSFCTDLLFGVRIFQFQYVSSDTVAKQLGATDPICSTILVSL